MDDSEFYTVGVDLGQSRDPTAIAILRKAGDLYQLGHLERLPLQTPYPRIVDHVIGILSRLPRGSELVIDHTGVGRPVFDMFERCGVNPIGVTITSGEAITRDGDVYRVPKLRGD